MEMVCRYRQWGLTVIELLVALALGVVLAGGITQLYLENKRNYVQDEAVARLQENGRFATGLLKRELKMAGFMGIGAAVEDLAVANVTKDCVSDNSWALDFSSMLDFVNDFTGGELVTVRGVRPGMHCIEASHVLPGTDILIVKRVADTETVKNGQYNQSIEAGQEKRNHWYLQVEYDPVVPGSVRDAGFVYVDSNGFAKSVVAPKSTKNMWMVKNHIFYIRNYSVSIGDGIPTLMMVSLNKNRFQQQALIEGVEAFHIEFGVPDADSHGTPVKFISDPLADDLNKVTVARFYLLLRSRDPLKDYTDKKSYRLGSQSLVEPSDRRFMRRVFTTTVGLRNLNKM